MSFHDSSHTGISIFLNKQNMAMSLPLISICVVYAYFKLLPITWSVPLLLLVAVVSWTTTMIKKRAIQKREEKIAAMDEDVLNDLAADEMAKQVKEEQKAAKKIRKEHEKVRQRIVAQKKHSGKGIASSNEDEDEVDEHDLRTFASSYKKK